MLISAMLCTLNLVSQKNHVDVLVCSRQYEIHWNVKKLCRAYRIARKFGRELNLAVWWIDQPAAKLQSANIKSFV